MVTLLGRNGMGKTTTISTIMGLLRVSRRKHHVRRRGWAACRPTAIAQAGLGLVPEGRQIFPTLNVEENLIATAAARFGAPRWRFDDVYRAVPESSPSGAATWATNFPAASNKCWRSGGA